MRVWWIPFWAALLLVPPAFAQTSRGTVTGTVTDASGAVVRNASVALTHSATRLLSTSSTNDFGLYRFDAVDLGEYNLQVTHPGFKTFVEAGIRVEANRVLVLDVRLEVGPGAETIQVSGAADAAAVRDGPLRGGNFLPAQVSQLPLTDLNPLSIARALPGVVQPSGTALIASSGGAAIQFSVNGQRTHGNTFLLDGTENNDIAFTGAAQPFNIADAVEEVSVQTSNFSVEFGRAAGGVLNIVTKSGTDSLHGTLFWRYQSQRFDSVSSYNRLTGVPQSVFVHNLAGFTAGGPIRKDRTFFYSAFQEESNRSTANFGLVVPTAAAVDRLRTLFPDNPRLDLYLSALGNLRGTAAPLTLLLGVDPQTGVNRQTIQFATAVLSAPHQDGGPEWLVRFDHFWSPRQRISARYIYDSRLSAPSAESFPGFISNAGEQNQNFLFTDSYTFSPTFTNEFRFSYGRLHADQSVIALQSVALAKTLPAIIITNVASPGTNGNQQYRYADNFLFQETQTKLNGRHTLRYGIELLKQIATQRPAGKPRGEVDFNNSPGYSAFANYLDDFSGQPGRILKTFGGDVIYPDQFRQAYFLQDTWNAAPGLTLTTGLRYDNFGQPVNSLPYPAFTGFDPALFAQPNHVNTDNLDLGPAFGVAFAPLGKSGLLGSIFGDRKTVWRGGYQISYEPLYTQIMSLDLATSTPNAITIDHGAFNPVGRGDFNWYEQLPAATPGQPSLGDAQYGTLEKNFRNPYTERWSFGFQRQLGGESLLDMSYVGAEGHRLTTRADMNPLLPGGMRLYPDFGPRTVRTSQGNSAYHSLQAQYHWRFEHGLQFTASYTWSRSLDSTSEGIGQVDSQFTNSNLTSIPVSQGGMKLDRGLSDFDRSHRLTLLYVWETGAPTKRWRKLLFGGWSIAGITTFQTATPFTVLNGYDRNRDGWPGDRPDIGNPNAPANTRAVCTTVPGLQGCSTGFRELDTGATVGPADVRWVEGSGFPNGSTVGRNTLHTGGTNNFDAALLRRFAIGDHVRLEFRGEAQNMFNHPQYVNVPPRDVVNTPQNQFLNRAYTDPGIRSMWLQVKVLF